MATSSSPTPATAQQIAQQRTAQRTAVSNANSTLQSPEFQAATNNIVPQAEAKDAAELRFRGVLANLKSTKAEIEAAKNDFIAASDTYSNTIKQVTAGVSQASGQLAQGVTYGAQQERTAGVQSTSPAPTFEQDQQEARAVGNAAENQPVGNPPVIPPIAPEPPPYNPTLLTPVDPPSFTGDESTFVPTPQEPVTVLSTTPVVTEREEPQQTVSSDEVFNQLRQDFREQGFAEPQVPYVFNQGQLDYIESYNNALASSGNAGLQVEANSPEALDVLIERGQIQPDDDGFPEEQKSVNEEPGIEVTISGVGFEEFQDEGGLGEAPTTAGGFIGEDTEEFPAANRGVQSLVNTAREQSVGKAAADWRVRIKLADAADYFYNSDQPGIMAPLRSTNGVIFPYTPQISVTYAASYTPLDVIHTNYKFYSYKNSSVENLMITADFTAQNTVEANYLLAVIHFFRSATKMFYGQDQNPSRGVPPPLMYLSGYGPYQFDNHPVVITNFTYNLPVDVDYISAYPTNNSNALGGVNLAPYMPTAARSYSPLDRLRSLVSSGIAKGGLPPPPNFQNSQNINESTRVPTKINIQLSCLPITTRNAVSNKFSLKNYANGSLLRGSVNPGTGGGFW